MVDFGKKAAMATIHPTAVIEDDAVIGANAEIGPYAVILRGVTIGPNCRIHAGAVIGDLPQDLAFQPAESFVRIGADCVVREHVTIHRGTKPGTATVVGDGCYLMANSHLAHNVRLGNRVVVANGALLAGYVEVGDGAFISGNVVIHQFVRIGRLAMLSGGCGIGKDVPPFCTTVGIQRNSIGGLNAIGMRRAGLSPAERAQVKQAFDFLYRSNLNVSQALDRMRQEFADGPAMEFLEFVATSRRGICPMRGSAGEEGADT
jgi:UDP-N-acetylglucosamine acyltransferase